MRRRLAVAALLAALATRAGATPEIYVDDPVWISGIADQTITSSFEQTPNMLAWDGAEFLAAWVDARPDAPGVYVARVDAAGTVLDPGGIRLSTTATMESVQVAWNGGEFLVAWSGAAARVAADGTVLDPGGFSTGIANPGGIASDGTDFLIVYSANTAFSSNDVRAKLVTAGGSVGAAIDVSADPSLDEKWPSVCFNGTDYLVVWTDDRNISVLTGIDVFGARVSGAGSVVDAGGFAISTGNGNQIDPRCASEGGDSLVVWQDPRGGAARAYGARVADDGTVRDPSGLAIGPSSPAQNYPAVGAAGGDYLVGWRSASGPPLEGVRVDSTGAVVDATPILLVDGDFIGGTAIAGGDGFLAACEVSRESSGQNDLVGNHLDAAGTVSHATGIEISETANLEFHPGVAFDGSDYLVAWVDNRTAPLGTTYEGVHAARVNREGVSLDLAAIDVDSTGPWSGRHPAVASDGSTSLIVWRIGNSVYGARVDGAGRLLDLSPRILAADSDFTSDPAIAFDGSNYLVTWTRSWDYIRATRVTPAGVGSTIVDVTTGAGPPGEGISAVAYDGTQFLVVWPENGGSSSASPNIWGRFVDGSGAAVGAAFPISTGLQSKESPAVASNGSGSLVVWKDARTGAVGIYAARVGTDGTVADPAGIAVALGNLLTDPTVAFDGTDYVVAWVTTAGIQAKHVTTAGTVLEATPIDISTATGVHATPVAAAGGLGEVIVVYSRYDGATPFGAKRVRGRLLCPTGGCIAPDAGVPDAGPADAAPPDASGGPDALSGGPDALSGGPDALSGGPDALSGGPDAGGGSDGGGCSCRIGAPTHHRGFTGATIAALFALLLVRLRTRGRGAHGRGHSRRA